MAPAAAIPIQLTSRAFDIDEARRFGLTREHLRGSSWRRLGGGFYALRTIADDPIVALGAVSRRMPSDAVFSGRTAAWLRGLDLPPCDPIDVTLPPASLMSRLSRTVVRCSNLSPSEVARRRGLRVTSIDRTIADLGRRLPLIEAVAVLDMAMHRRLVSEAHLRAWIACHPRFPGIAWLRRAIELAEPGTESVMETRLRLLVVLAGLPRTRLTDWLWNTTVPVIARHWSPTTGAKIACSTPVIACSALPPSTCCPLRTPSSRWSVERLP